MPRVSKQDALIESIYRQYCGGMPISVMRIPALFKMAREMIDDGKSTITEVGAAMVAFIEQEKL